MPKRVADGEKRVALNCLVLPETRDWLKGAKEHGSQGELVDRAVANLRMMLGETGVVEYRPARIEEAAYGDGGSVDYMSPSEVSQARKLNELMEPLRAKPPARERSVQSWKRGPRPKGDKSR